MKNIIVEFEKKRNSGIPISVVTCYDFSFARILEKSQIDVLLVGDSLGMVVQGHGSTLPVSLEDMIYHARAVRRGAPSKLLVVDMPFLSYQISIEEGIKNAGKLMQETACDAVKVEGSSGLVLELTKRLKEMGVPVIGHLGLTPQSFQTLGGYRIQGRTEESQYELQNSAKKLEDSGAVSIVLEMIPESLGKTVSESLRIPTIGIGAGRHTGGQVLVLQDLLGMDESFHPKFLKKYANLGSIARTAFDTYHKEILERQFPKEEHSF